MAAIGVRGKSCTFTYKSLDASAQVTSYTVSRSSSTESVQTLAGTVQVASDTEVEVSAEFLFDPTTSGIYGLLHAAWKDGSDAALALDQGGATTTLAKVKVTSLSDTVPADGLATCSVTLTSAEADAWVGKATQ